MISVSFAPYGGEKIIRAMSAVRSEASKQVTEDMPRTGAIHFRDRVADAILSGKYVGTGWAYSQKYKEWKKKTWGGDKFWMLAGDLLGAITMQKTDSGWFSGVPKGVMDSGGKSWFGGGKRKPIAYYGSILEWNTKKPRPVFTPALADFKKDDWPDIGVNGLGAIKSKWR